MIASNLAARWPSFFSIVLIFGAIVRVCAQAVGDSDAPRAESHEDTLQMLLEQQMDEHELMSTGLSQGISSNCFDQRA